MNRKLILIICLISSIITGLFFLNRRFDVLYSISHKQIEFIGFTNTDTEKNLKKLIKKSLIRSPIQHTSKTKIILYSSSIWQSEKDPQLSGPSNKRISIAYAPSPEDFIPHEWIFRLNHLFDAMAVSSSSLVSIYEQAGVKIPIFVLPLTFDLKHLLKRPIKTTANPTFIFAQSSKTIDTEGQISLIRAFVSAFKKEENVALYLNSEQKDISSRQIIIDEIAQYQDYKIFFSQMSFEEYAYKKFFFTVDFFIGLGKRQNLLPIYETLALGIPVLVADNQDNKDLCQNNIVASIPTKYENRKWPDQTEITQSLKSVYKNYNYHIFKASRSRAWVATYDTSHALPQSLCLSLLQPDKMICGKKNTLSVDYLQTNSKEFYLKCQNLCLSNRSKFSKQRKFDINSLLKPISLNQEPSGLKEIDCIYVINLDERPERWERTKNEFKAQRLNPQRISAINGWNLPISQKIDLLEKNSPLLKIHSGGAIGCLLSHLSVYKNALDQGFNTIWVSEDDIIFHENAEEISHLINSLNSLDPHWDVLYTDYWFPNKLSKERPRSNQVAYKPTQTIISDELIKIRGRRNTHSMILSGKGLKKIYNYFTSKKLWTPIDVDLHYIPNLKQYSPMRHIVSSIYDSSILNVDGNSDTQETSFLNK